MFDFDFFHHVPVHSSCFLTNDGMEVEPGDITGLNAATCAHDYDNQICPFDWKLELDGDTCISPNDYTGPCPKILRGMGRLQVPEKAQVANICKARWLCKDEMSEDLEKEPVLGVEEEDLLNMPTLFRIKSGRPGYLPYEGSIKENGEIQPFGIPAGQSTDEIQKYWKKWKKDHTMAVQPEYDTTMKEKAAEWAKDQAIKRAKFKPIPDGNHIPNMKLLKQIDATRIIDKQRAAFRPVSKSVVLNDPSFGEDDLPTIEE